MDYSAVSHSRTRGCDSIRFDDPILVSEEHNRHTLGKKDVHSVFIPYKKGL